MSRATLRAHWAVTAAAVVTGFLFVAAPAASAQTTTSATAGVTHVSAATTHAPVVVKTKATPTAHQKLMAHHDALVRKVIKEAKRQKGKPYIYGDAGPHGFDCSGLVRYVFLHSVHRSLPHNAAAQYSVLRHIHRSQLMVGDLIFTDNGYISHVGIYDGHGYWWVAPHTGTHVQRQKIYSAHFVYARVLVLHKHLS